MGPKPPSSGGFTLAELAIVVLIVGLLASAVLGATRLLAQSRLIRTAADVQVVGAATAIFADRYGALPGDLPEAGTKLPGCASPTCEIPSSASTTGDGHIGAPGQVSAHQTGRLTVAGSETELFWKHLALTGLISSVSSEPDAISVTWGVSHPAAPVGGGFHVKDADGGVLGSLPGWPPLAQQPNGTMLILQQGVDRDLVPAAAGTLVLTASEAAWIDRKIDDGNPFDGDVVGYGTVTMMMAGSGCFAWSAADRGSYDESASDRDCGLAFRIAP